MSEPAHGEQLSAKATDAEVSRLKPRSSHSRSSSGNNHSNGSNNRNGGSPAFTPQHKGKGRRSNNNSLDGSAGGFLLTRRRQNGVNSPLDGKPKGRSELQAPFSPVKHSPESSSSSTNVSSGGPQKGKGESMESSPTHAVDSRSKEAVRMASLFMNMKLTTDEVEGRKDEFPQYHQPAPDVPVSSLVKPGEPNSPVTSYSAGTAYRVRKTKAKFELHYQMIRNFQYRDLNEALHGATESSDDDIFSNVGNNKKLRGVYNPLQTIRNRVHRPVQTYNRNEFYWHVPPQELVQDYAWQQRSGHLMRDRRGRPVNRESDSEPHSKSPHHHHHHHLHSYSKTYGDELIQRIKSKLGQRSSHGESDSSLSDYEYHSTPQSPSRLSEDARRQASASPLHEDDGSAAMSPVKEVAIEHIHERGGSENGDARTESSASKRKSPKVSIAVPENDESTNTKLSERAQESDPNSLLANQLEYLDLVYYLSYLQLAQKYQCSGKLQQGNDHSRSFSQDIMELSRDAIDNKVPAARTRLEKQENEIRQVHSDLSYTKAPRMDQLLVESDKIISEVSTTLNLEVRRTGERLDRLEGDSPSPMKFVNKSGYFVLEWTMVIVMWILWLLVSVSMTVRGVFRLTFAIIRWLLFL